MNEPNPGSDTDDAVASYEHLVAKAIDRVVQRIRDIEDCERFFVPLAVEQKTTERKAIAEDAVRLRDSLSASDEPATGGTLRALVDIVRRLDRVQESQRAKTLRASLFLGIFSAFDTFSGDLLGALFSLRPQLFNRLNREVPVAEILGAATLEELKARVLGDWVEDVRRKSYVEQFEVLERVFDIKLKAFNKWHLFVEITQRRNLVAHCDGVVSPQYIEICQREGNHVDVAVGTQLTLTEGYFTAACTTVAEVALKLGQTLWRKVAPAESAIADKHLHRLAYDALQFSEWNWAKTICDFGLGQKKASTEQNRRVFVVNQAIALARSGGRSAANALLEEEDWSAASPEFRLAVAVLQERYEEASDLMVRIGHRGDLLDDSGYHDWPLFRDFRGTPQFLAAYEKVYGRRFVVQLTSSGGTPGVLAQSTDVEPSA